VGRADAVGLPLADDVEGHPADAAVLVLEEVDDEGVLDDVDAGVVLHGVQRRDEGAADLAARRVTAGVAIRSRWWPPSRVKRISPSGPRSNSAGRG